MSSFCGTERRPTRTIAAEGADGACAPRHDVHGAGQARGIDQTTSREKHDCQ
jgi:hypothetical protein